MSLNGYYAPATIGGNGIKSYIWFPKYFRNSEYRPRLLAFVIYCPPYLLDKNFWHDDYMGRGPCDKHININGHIVEMK